jgi:hypothetical protein
VDTCAHFLPGSNRQAVGRLDDAAGAASIRNPRATAEAVAGCVRVSAAGGPFYPFRRATLRSGADLRHGGATRPMVSRPQTTHSERAPGPRCGAWRARPRRSTGAGAGGAAARDQATAP